MPRAKKVKLDLSGLRKFERSLGNGITFSPGLYRKKEATKGFYLEYGTENQPSRPWLSSILDPNSPTLKEIFKHLRELVQDALRGENSKYKIALKITTTVQNHLLDQEFETKALSNVTVDKKRKSGASLPEHIGLDTFDMADSIKTKVKGGRRIR